MLFGREFLLNGFFPWSELGPVESVNGCVSLQGVAKCADMLTVSSGGRLNEVVTKKPGRERVVWS